MAVQCNGMLRWRLVMLTLAALAVPTRARATGEVSRAVEVRRGVDFEIVQPGWDALARRPLFAPAMRPTLSGPEKTRPTADGCCLIHWTESGTDAVVEDSLADLAPANGLPDAIDAIEEGLIGGRQMFARDLGWPEAPPDAGTVAMTASMSM